jgi:tetratricopeptide (TPR) repeat protein
MERVSERATPGWYRDAIAAALLAVAAFATFAPALDYQFVNYDDNTYVTGNDLVRKGLSLEGVRWAFTTFAESNWHPLTWLSLQLDASLSRKPDGSPNPFGFHLTSVLIHAANAAILFLALRSLTGAFWPSAVVALLFAVHPLRAESVAWVAERKDVLSVFFGLLALWAYAGYVHRPTAWRYLAVAALFVLSLLSKPMLVTLPCLFLVLDWWPLRRAETAGQWRELVVEKLPLFALTVASSVVTYQAQSHGKALRDLSAFSPAVRVENAALSYVLYLGQTVWPTGLAVYYPHRGANLSLAAVTGAAVLLVALTAGAVLLRRRAPYLLTGWLWYLGTLVPVIGLVQLSDQARADRYSYFPQVGLLLAACWAVADLAAARPRLALASGLIAAGALAVETHRHLPVWHDSVALWEQSVAVTGPSVIGKTNLGTAQSERGNAEQAVECFREVVDLAPKSVDAYANLGVQLSRLGRLDEATEVFHKALSLNEDFAPAHTYLGNILVSKGKLQEAKREHETAIRLDPKLSDAYCNLGSVELSLHNPERAAECFRTAVELRPAFAVAWCGLGDALIQLSRVGESAEPLREAVRLNPRFGPAHALLGRALAARHDDEGAARHFEQATVLLPKSAESWHGLGMARVRLGQTPVAVENLTRAVRLEPKAPYRADLAEALESLAASLARVGRNDDAAAAARRAREEAAAAERTDLVRRIEGQLRDYERARPGTTPRSTP